MNDIMIKTPESPKLFSPTPTPSPPPSEKKEECIELKNINYKNMLLTGNPLKDTKSLSSTNNLENLDQFLNSENDNNKKEQWCKLNKTIKLQKFQDFVQKYKKEHNLNEEEEKSMISFLRGCLDKKRLQRVKDVIYDKDLGVIKDIPLLLYDKPSKHFTLKNVEKTAHMTTMKSLTPKKSHVSTIKQPISSSSSNASLKY
jgi:hypothetical protein